MGGRAQWRRRRNFDDERVNVFDAFGPAADGSRERASTLFGPILATGVSHGTATSPFELSCQASGKVGQ